ncbi:hypothetical protein [Breznakiella homolactica]|uniref:Uncharacterized protein n=1 Tax=Breznakiella homolactica TaxID=2798577 RepID=A0A7T7XML8_9SPIR|nr:hypothetical protein [Breznakiella homolactica]QQO09130.1 hypothetical protein JFL75_19715 [Breznakiella homolactica]
MDQTVQYRILLIAAAVVSAVGAAAYIYTRRKLAIYKTGLAGTGPGIPLSDPGGNDSLASDRRSGRRVFRHPGKNSGSDDHPLGAVQTVIPGRIRFAGSGILLIAAGIFALYIFHFTDRDFYLERTGINLLIGTVLFLGAAAWGFQLIYFATCRIRLRETGFELCSVLGTSPYEYRDADFSLSRTVEHKHNSDGYRPVFARAGNFNYIWQCRVTFSDGRPPLLLRSSRYAWLKPRIDILLENLEWKD